jgi:predicted LPLAT superfamily acyltransferase
MGAKQPSWHQQPEKGSVRLLGLSLWLYKVLGRRVFMLILNVIVGWYWLFARQVRQHSLAYLSRLHHYAAAASPFEQAPTWWHSFVHLRQFAISILDKMEAWLGQLTPQRLHIFGHQHLRQYYQRGAVVLVSHFGNIELLHALKAEHVQKVSILVYRKHAEQFNQFLSRLNAHAATRLIAVDEIGIDTALLLQQSLEAGEWIVIAADRLPIASTRQQNIDFLGTTAAWPEGAWLLAHLLKAPVLAVFCYRQQQQWQLHVHAISTALVLPRQGRQHYLQQLMQHYVLLLQQHCLRAPYQWFNFYDFWRQD